MTKCAFAPAHVSGLFAVHDEVGDDLAKGSRGAGWCIHKGAWAAAIPGEETTISINGKLSAAPVTTLALNQLAPDANFAIDIRLDLPTGQGFGMSAAGTLAACLAVASELDLEPEYALEATHHAEVTHGTGLGDAIGSWFGGGELRLKPGVPPHGWAMQIHPPTDQEFLFLTMGDAVPTASIIRDSAWKSATRRHGDAAVDRILDAGRDMAWRTLLVEAHQFSLALGLMPEAMHQLGDELPDDVLWGQCMLGSTLWVTGDTGDLERAEALMEGRGEMFRSTVDPNGARMVKGLPPLRS